MMNIREFGKELWRYRGKSFGLTQEQTYIFVKAFRDLLIDKVCREGEVRINKLGTFYVYETKERLAYDFHKKETFTIPPHKKIAFKPSSYIDGQANFIADGNWENAYRQ
jgi:nucleoid DNA-binding protein